MSDEAPTNPVTPPERARIEPSPPPRRTDGLPILYVVGFVILAAALFYVYRHPPQPRGAAQESARVDALTKEAVARQQEYDILSKRLTALEAKPAPAPVNLAPIESKVAALESRPPPPPPTDLDPLTSRIEALEKRQPPDLGPIKSQLDSLGKQQAELANALPGKLNQVTQQATASLEPVKSQLDALGKKQADAANANSGKIGQVSQQVDALGNRLDDVEKQAKQNASDLGSLKNQAQQFGQLQAANVALNAGQPLGEIPGAPPALAQFAHNAPPTESGLRLSFEQAAEAARHASQPALTNNQNFVDRMWTRAQQSVTIRQGDDVIVGDPISGTLESARQKLDAGDLAGAVKALDGLAGPARAAMSDWIGQATSLLNARAAIAQMAART